MDIKAPKPASSVAILQEKGNSPVPATQIAAVVGEVPKPAPPAAPERLDPSMIQDLRARQEAVAERVRQYLRQIGRDLDFQVDSDSGDAVITVRDSSGNVVRRIPGEEALQQLQRLNVESGTFFDSMA